MSLGQGVELQWKMQMGRPEKSTEQNKCHLVFFGRIINDLNIYIYIISAGKSV